MDRAIAAVGLVALLVAASVVGVTLTAGQQAELPDGKRAVEAYSDLSGVEGVRTVTVRRGDRVVSERSYRFEMVPGTPLAREETVAPASRAGNLRVTNGSVEWTYDASEDTLSRTLVSGPSPVGHQNDTYVSFLREAFDNLSVSVSPTVSAAPLVPAEAAPVRIRGLEGRFNVTLAGTATVLDRRAYVVELDAVDGRTNATVWVDAEHLYPLKSKKVTYQNGERRTVTMVHTEVRFGVEFSEDRFEMSGDR